MQRRGLDDLAAFMAVAEHRGFRAAAARLGVTPSALSHTLRQLEDRLGVRLLHRTTRSVSLTDTGGRLLARLRPALEQVFGALDDLNLERGRPFGRLRVYLTRMSAAAVIGPVWQRYVASYPDVQLELQVGEPAVDIVAHGFDAGIGPRDRVAADLVAVRVMGPLKVAVVGAPAYFARHGRPRVPADLARHSCVRYRRPDGTAFEWLFERNGRSQKLQVGRAIPALGSAGAGAGRLVAVVRGIVPVLSRPPPGSRRPARADRSGLPRHRRGRARRVGSEPVHGRLTPTAPREKSSLLLSFKNVSHRPAADPAE
jgi:DNA-binding transcriptional LysR family regulator